MTRVRSNGRKRRAMPRDAKGWVCFRRGMKIFFSFSKKIRVYNFTFFLAMSLPTNDVQEAWVLPTLGSALDIVDGNRSQQFVPAAAVSL